MIRNFNLPAIGLLALFAATTYAGAKLLAFQTLADYVIPDALAKAIAEPSPDYGPTKSSVSAWVDVAGIATQARRLALRLVLIEAPGDVAAIEEALSKIAEASPTTAAAWQALVETRSARGAPIESVLAALRMSTLTASHEGYFMMMRAIFGLEHWSELKEQDRRSVIADVLATIKSAADMQHRDRMTLERYRLILANKSEAERNNIRDALVGSGLATKQVLDALGA